MKQQVMTKARLLKEVYRLDPQLKKKECEPERDAVLLLLGAIVDGPNRANKTAQISETRRRRYMKNLRKNKVFVGNKIHAEWDDPENGGYALMLDANVALGYMERTNAQEG
jgi:hypothetical protein